MKGNNHIILFVYMGDELFLFELLRGNSVKLIKIKIVQIISVFVATDFALNLISVVACWVKSDSMVFHYVCI